MLEPEWVNNLDTVNENEELTMNSPDRDVMVAHHIFHTLIFIPIIISIVRLPRSTLRAPAFLRGIGAVNPAALPYYFQG